MGHYAKIEESKVVAVIVIDDDLVSTLQGIWIKTSYNTRAGIYYNPSTQEPDEDQSKALRKNFAGIGYDYDKKNDAFVPPKPSATPSFVLDPFSFVWVPPTPKPEGDYFWVESTQRWEPTQKSPFDDNELGKEISL